MAEYLESTKIKMFPSAYREESSDPESYFTTEGNLTKNNVLGFSSKNFIEVDASNNVTIVLGGYRFTATLSNLQALQSKSAFASATKIYACIKTLDKGSQNTYKTLVAFGSGNTILDDSGNFVGLAFDSSTTGASASILLFERADTSSAWSIPASSKLNVSTTQISNGDSSTDNITQRFTTNNFQASYANISSASISTVNANAITFNNIYGGSITLGSGSNTTSITSNGLSTYEINVSTLYSGCVATSDLSATYLYCTCGASIVNADISNILSVDISNIQQGSVQTKYIHLPYYNTCDSQTYSWNFGVAQDYLTSYTSYGGNGTLVLHNDEGNYYLLFPYRASGLPTYDMLATEKRVFSDSNTFYGSNAFDGSSFSTGNNTTVKLNKLKTYTANSSTTRGAVSVNTSNGELYSENLTTDDPSSVGTSYNFIDSISQSRTGKITVTKKGIPTASDIAYGLVSTTTQYFAGDKTFEDAVTCDTSISSPKYYGAPWESDGKTIKNATVAEKLDGLSKSFIKQSWAAAWSTNGWEWSQGGTYQFLMSDDSEEIFANIGIVTIPTDPYNASCSVNSPEFLTPVNNSGTYLLTFKDINDYPTIVLKSTVGFPPTQTNMTTKWKLWIRRIQ